MTFASARSKFLGGQGTQTLSPFTFVHFLFCPTATRISKAIKWMKYICVKFKTKQQDDRTLQKSGLMQTQTDTEMILPKIVAANAFVMSPRTAAIRLSISHFQTFVLWRWWQSFGYMAFGATRKTRYSNKHHLISGKKEICLYDL